MPSRTFSFVRHGEAAHNVLIAGGKAEEGRAILDPHLTELGNEQASKLADEVAPSYKNFDIIVTSPLSRALQTTAHVYDKMRNARVIVTALHTENGIPVGGDPKAGKPCQRGESVATLRPRYPPTWDWAAVDHDRNWTTDGEGFFVPLPVQHRLPLFREFLERLPADKDILVVGHSGFFKELFGQEQKMANCELLTKALDG